MRCENMMIWETKDTQCSPDHALPTGACLPLDSESPLPSESIPANDHQTMATSLSTQSDLPAPLDQNANSAERALMDTPKTVSYPKVATRARYPCLQSNCEASFTRISDLKRHSKTVHRPELLDCPYAHAFCGRTGEKGFTRRDHLNEHIREVHLQEFKKKVKQSSESAYR